MVEGVNVPGWKKLRLAVSFIELRRIGRIDIFHPPA
jgi:hypothetical protein